MGFLRRLDGMSVLWIGAAAAYSWVAAGQRPFTTAEEVLVAIPALVVLAIAVWSPTRPRSQGSSSHATAVAWIALAIVAVSVELHAYLSSPRSDHPTMSSIADDVMSVRPGRAVVFALWLGLGWVLVRGARSARR